MFLPEISFIALIGGLNDNAERGAGHAEIAHAIVDPCNGNA